VEVNKMDKREKAQNKHLQEIRNEKDLHKKAEIISDVLNDLETCNGLDQFFEEDKNATVVRKEKLNEVELTALKKFRDAQGFKPDEMHDISNKMIKRQKDVAYKQDEYGINKYNVPLRSSHNYDWLKMATEEIVDLCKYLECEMERKQTIKDILSHAVLIRDWNLVEFALKELNKDGTGK
jgi:hypothetical protein